MPKLIILSRDADEYRALIEKENPADLQLTMSKLFLKIPRVISGVVITVKD